MTDIEDGRAKPRPGIEAQREAIREAAAVLFAESGSQAVSISQICKQAQISRPTFYRCFADKEALIASLYQLSIFEPVQDILLSKLTGSDISEGSLKEALYEMLDAMFEHGPWAELVFAESNNPTSPAFQIVNTAFDQAAKATQLWLQSSGRPVLDDKTLKAVMAACQWLVHDAIRAGLTKQAVAEAKASTWALVSTLMAGLEKP